MGPRTGYKYKVDVVNGPIASCASLALPHLDPPQRAQVGSRVAVLRACRAPAAVPARRARRRHPRAALLRSCGLKAGATPCALRS